MSFLGDIFKSVIKKITKLSRPNFSLIENQLVFKIDSDNFYKYPLDNIEIKTRHDSYIFDAYTLNSDNLYLEYIHLDNEAQWISSPLHNFVELMKSSLKIKNLEKIEDIEFEHYTFLTYEVDDEYILNLIYIYEMDKDIFIIDFKSDLYINLIKNFKNNYVFRFQRNSEISSLPLNFSLVKSNATKNYFVLASSEG